MVGRDTYYVLVVLDGSGSDSVGEEEGERSEEREGRIVGTGALVVERKFIHDLGKVGHIEDIAVARDQQGKKLGLRIIQALDFVAEKVGCYKVGSIHFPFLMRVSRYSCLGGVLVTPG